MEPLLFKWLDGQAEFKSPNTELPPLIRPRRDDRCYCSNFAQLFNISQSISVIQEQPLSDLAQQRSSVKYFEHTTTFCRITLQVRQLNESR